jgi:hypothetical protein
MPFQIPAQPGDSALATAREHAQPRTPVPKHEVQELTPELEDKAEIISSSLVH